ncbi:MAG: hypothetical protein B6I28_03795 [Fusobacteriia bacterium 4572_132]|nr:MAG: hypothetical protein B6I28_03795 [Fusobacteriia bacterium 4572_132]
MENNGGLTVFEILISVAIIAMLSYFTFPKYAMILRESKKVNNEKELKVFREAIIMYKMKKGKYPRTLEILEKEEFIDFGGRLSEKYKIKYKKKDEKGFFLDSYGNRYLYDNNTGKVWIKKRLKK